MSAKYLCNGAVFQRGVAEMFVTNVRLNGLKMVLMRIGFVFGPFFSLSVSSSPPLPGIIGKLRDADARLRSQFYVSQFNVPIFYFFCTNKNV